MGRENSRSEIEAFGEEFLLLCLPFFLRLCPPIPLFCLSPRFLFPPRVFLEV
jgi:hypothetical protein